MKLADLLLHVSSLEGLDSKLVENVTNYFTKIDKVYPDKLDLLSIDNICRSFQDELLFEWIIDNYYVQVRIRSDEVRLEAKTPRGRFTKYHPICYKVVLALNECLDVILHRNNNEDIHS